MFDFNQQSLHHPAELRIRAGWFEAGDRDGAVLDRQQQRSFRQLVAVAGVTVGLAAIDVTAKRQHSSVRAVLERQIMVEDIPDS